MEMTWWLKHLLDKCEDLGLTPQEPHKKPLTEKKMHGLLWVSEYVDIHSS